MSFAYEKLVVYKKALDSYSGFGPHLELWSRQHAFVDHLSRAQESVLFNLVEATRLQRSPKKMQALDCAIGSVLECAACVDIAQIKRLADRSLAWEKKLELLEVCRMLIGLRRSWKTPCVGERAGDYHASKCEQSRDCVFHHESLDMYRAALKFFAWLEETTREPGSRIGFLKSVDGLATRVVLNIAEGNGRYSQLSRQTFLDTANQTAARLAVSLDMGACRGIWREHKVLEAKRLLERIGQMTARKGYR